MKLRLKEDPREWRKFSWALGGFLAVVGVVMAWRGWVAWSGAAVLGAVGVTLALLGTWLPRGFRLPYRCAMRVGHRVGQGVGRVLLFGVFVLLVVPLGGLLRVLGYDLLRLKTGRGSESYWRPARPPGPLDRMY
jgi:hypothetical protein